jgi:hypothetical protein
MRIQVNCRKDADPESFYLAGRKLYVVRVLERSAWNEQRHFRVRVTDGREFVLTEDRATGTWTLARVQPRAA